MSTKKTISIMILIIAAVFTSANFMVAQAYIPLVRIPGLPAEGEITLSQYTVGLYNFLLSIVGIVAVIMLIIGGMKYITAVGNSSVIADAKDTIWNAIFGLLLALLSWIIVSTINPDVLYIKNPTSGLETYIRDLGSCGTFDESTGICECKSGRVTAAGEITSQAACHSICHKNDCGMGSSASCVKNSIKPDSKGNCTCVNDEVIQAPATFSDCNDVCVNNCLVADAKIGIVPQEKMAELSIEELQKRYASSDQIEAYDKSAIIVDGKFHTVSGNPIVTYEWDADFDGAYDSSPSKSYVAFSIYVALLDPLPSACGKIGSKINCEIKLRVTDSMGNQSVDSVYFTVE